MNSHSDMTTLKKVWFLVAVIAMPLTPCVGTTNSAPDAPSQAIEEKLLGNLHDDVVAMVASTRGAHFAYAAFESGKVVVVVDGQRQGVWDGFADGTLTLSMDGARVAYSAKREDKVVMVVDGKEQGAYDSVGRDSPVFSKDGKRLGFAARRGTKWFVVVDGKDGPEFDIVGKGTLVFSDNSARVAYGAIRNGKYFAVVDDVLSPQYDGIGAIVLSADGRRSALIIKTAHGVSVMLDGTAVSEYDGIGKDGLAFSPDSRGFGFAARRGGKWFAVVDGKPSPEFDFAGKPTFNCDGTRVAYWAESNTKQFVVINEEKGQEHDSLGTTRSFSPDGKHFVYVAQDNGKWSAVLDGKCGPSHDEIIKGSMVFGPQKCCLAYGAREGQKSIVVVDGKQLGEQYEGVSHPRFDPSGTHCAFVAESAGKQSVVLDGVSGRNYDTVLVFDFCVDGRVEYAAVRDGRIYRVSQSPKGRAIQ